MRIESRLSLSPVRGLRFAPGDLPGAVPMAHKVAARAALFELNTATVNYCRMTQNVFTPLKERAVVELVVAPPRHGLGWQDKLKARGEIRIPVRLGYLAPIGATKLGGQ